MDKDDLLLLFAYNRWANQRVLEACAGLAPEQLFAPAQVSFVSLMGNLAHILGAEQSWRLRLQEGISPTHLLTARDFSSLEELNRLWQKEAAAMQGFIESLQPAETQGWVTFTTTSGKPQGSTVWKALVHVVNHGTQFRGEAGAALGSLGRSPGDLDFIGYLRESDQR